MAADPSVVDGPAAVTARIAEIQNRFEPPPVEADPAASGAAFDQVLQAEIGGSPLGASPYGGSPLGGMYPQQYGTPLGMPYGSGYGGGYPGVSGVGGYGTGVTPAQRLSPGEYGRLTPPAELVAYGNGRIPANALVSIGEGNHRLWAPAANSFNQMRAAAAADGVQIGVTDSYRSYDAQVRVAAEKGLYSQGGLAAQPGTSPHGWGLALDLDLDANAQAWMRENGYKYGFVEDVPREPWHWTFRPG